ncbi:MAG TPA: SDR family oxidoreductase [Pseudomonas sp.]|jgi:NAD(P)-dependent dehydrogenase (short-subunit alcohol dehydrogenase family)|nr:SDR family oxidoreductase [Pseudomonas sp.]
MYRKVFASKVFERKVVLVTGGCSGIGRALVLRFAQAGARPVILDLHREELDSLLLHLREHLNSDAIGRVCDVSDPQAVDRVMQEVIDQCGGIDLLVNNAGIAHRSRFVDTPRAVFEQIMAVNYFGALYCTQAALPSLLARQGQIIVLSSLSGFVPLHLRCAYSASKYALHGLFDTLRQEVREAGVNVLLVCPGFTATDMHSHELTGVGVVPPLRIVGRVTSAQDVAEAIFQAALRRRTQLVISNVGWRGQLLARGFPRLFQRLVLARRPSG